MKKKIFFTRESLIPVIIQEEKTRDVLMLGYMNMEAFIKTKENSRVYFWSRKKKRLWKKGETSGNELKVKKIFNDCDNDALLIKAELCGSSVCHKGTKSCFREINDK